MNLYIDLDDVLAKTTIKMIELLETNFSRKAEFDSIAEFDLRKSFNLTTPEHKQFLDILNRPENLLSIQPHLDAVNAVQLFAQTSCSVSIVTGRPPKIRKYSEEWLRKHNVPFQQIIHVDKYGNYPDDPGSIKLNDLQSFQFDLCIEDNYETAVSIINLLAIPTLLIDRPWNKNTASNPAQLKRVYNWDEIIRKVNNPGD